MSYEMISLAILAVLSKGSFEVGSKLLMNI
jgi:hypothetical protein